VEESSMLATGAVGRRLQYPGRRRRRRRDLTVKKSMEFLFQSHYLADISMKKLHHQTIAYITMEWRVQQHAREAVDPQYPVPQQQYNGHIINVDRPDEEEDGTAHTHTGLIKAS